MDRNTRPKMSAEVTSLARQVSNFVGSNPISFANGLLAVITFAAEQLVSSSAFKCPCDGRMAKLYSAVYLVGPAVLLFILGYLMNSSFWAMVHGHKHRQVATISNVENRQRPRQCYVIFVKACIAPSAWIFVALLDGKYVVCMMMACMEDESRRQEVRSISQICSWVFFLGVLVLTLLFLCCSRYRDSLTFAQSRYMNIYREQEKVAFETAMQAKAKALTEECVEKFLLVQNPTREDWDAICMTTFQSADLKQVSSNGEPFYTPLHLWCDKHSDKTQQKCNGK